MHTPAELLRVESAARQNSDIVVGHIPVLGLPGTISIFSIVHCLGWNETILYISCLFVFGDRAPSFDGGSVCVWNQIPVCPDDWHFAPETYGVSLILL